MIDSSQAKHFTLTKQIMSGVTKLLGLFFIVNGNMTEEYNSTSTVCTSQFLTSNETKVTTTFSGTSTDNTVFPSSAPTTTRKTNKEVDEQYERYMNVIKPTVYEVSFYVAVISVATGLVLNPVAALVFVKSGMGRAPIGEKTILNNQVFNDK